MPQDAGCSPEQLRKIQKAFDYLALRAIFITSAILIALAAVDNGLAALNVGKANSSLVTVIHKNRLHPSIAELEAHVGQTESKDEANSDESLVIEPQGQWI